MELLATVEPINYSRQTSSHSVWGMFDVFNMKINKKSQDCYLVMKRID